MKTALIVGNGEVREEILNDLPKNPYVICADGGIRHMKKLGLKADIIIGDMDSAGSEFLGENIIRYPVRKDFTDGEIAVDYAIEKGFLEVIMVGFTGTRMDHTLTNIFLLKKLSDNGIKAYIKDFNNTIYYAEKENIISGKVGDIISIIPLGGDVSGITTKGLDYPLSSETLEFAKSRGVSNIMTEKTCTITIEKGMALIIKSRD